MAKKYTPHGKFVVVRKRINETFHGIAVPQNSAEGTRYFIEAAGPDASHLKPGTQVHLIGNINEDFAYLPGEKDLIITDSQHIPYSIEE